MYQFINGVSSLLFVISAVKAFMASDLILWKLSNTVLIISSHLCNAYSFEKYLLFDYVMIYLTSLSYLNNSTLNSALVLSGIYEFVNTESIENTKNVTFGITLLKSITYAYIYINNQYFFIIVGVSSMGVIVYKIRYSLYLVDPIKTWYLTWIWHACVTTILYISSITAVQTECSFLNVS
jgi:hypothetical protein